MMHDETTRNALDILLALLAINSPSTEEQAFAAYLDNLLQNRGFTTFQDTTGNLWAALGGTQGREQDRTVLFNCHMDTVPTAVNVKPVVTQTIVASDGKTALGADDKGAVAALLAAMDSMLSQHLPHPPIQLLFTVSEELALAGARGVDTSQLSSICAGYTLDASGPVGQVVTMAPWKSEAVIVFTGRSAHAGFSPESGISAITLAADAIGRMQLGRMDALTTSNIGSIHGGGNTNIVCDKTTVHLEVRSLTEERVEQVLEQIASSCDQAVLHHGGSVSINITRLYPGYTIHPEDPALSRLRTAVESLGLPYSTITPGGGSDANILREAGIPVVVVSSGYNNPHTQRETMEIAELGNLARLVVALATLPTEDPS